MFPHLFKPNRLRVLPLGCIIFSAAGWQLGAPAIAQTANPNRVDLSNQAEYSYESVPQAGYPNSSLTFQGKTNRIQERFDQLIDPLGRVVGCNGEVLANYSGFSVGLYDADGSDPTGASIGLGVPLTRTELPDLPNNGIAAGVAPNIENANPFSLTNGTQGVYDFLLDPAKGQLNQGRAYILLVNTPPNAIYSPRRVRIVIGSRVGNVVSYTATSLDGKAIAGSNGQTTVTGTINITDAERTSLSLAVFDLSTGICQAQEIQITKTGDRASASPGDTVIYRLSVRNLSSAPVNSLEVIDNLPVGFKFVQNSARAEFKNTPLVVIANSIGNNSIKFTLPNTNLPSATTSIQPQVINIAYAATLTPDAMRGTGRNLASVQGQRSDNGQLVKDGPASHLMRLTPGIVADCGTIIGRVFEDKNFDGEQQYNEPGIPNAVVILDDGNRITTDANGLFSVANVQPGYRTGVLDLSSLPGYTLAPNRKFKERNSQSRLVNLAPSGMVRMNFAVTPAFQETGK
jgi:uncharacterized repeat protein (TIGR01451 family)